MLGTILEAQIKGKLTCLNTSVYEFLQALPIIISQDMVFVPFGLV